MVLDVVFSLPLLVSQVLQPLRNAELLGLHAVHYSAPYFSMLRILVHSISKSVSISRGKQQPVTENILNSSSELGVIEDILGLQPLTV